MSGIRERKAKCSLRTKSHTEAKRLENSKMSISRPAVTGLGTWAAVHLSDLGPRTIENLLRNTDGQEQTSNHEIEQSEKNI
jgi:hypothetical protein